MDWYIIAAFILLIVLTIILGVLLACMLAAQGCTISLQRRKPNQELTKIQQEKEQKKTNSIFKRLFRSSSQPEQPVAPVEDISTLEFTVKLHGEQNDSEQITKTDETAPALLLIKPLTQAERKRREKKRETIRKKYNL
jgi:predicted membrane protein